MLPPRRRLLSTPSHTDDAKEMPGLAAVIVRRPLVRAKVTLRCDNACMTPDDDGAGPAFDLDEGWFTDPWGLHDARWISLGRATDLVRDGDVEACDAPPPSPPTVAPALIPPEAPGQVGAADLQRAGDAEHEFVDPNALRRRLIDAAEEGSVGGAYVPPRTDD